MCLKLICLYHDTIIIGHTFCSIVKILNNKKALQKELKNVETPQPDALPTYRSFDVLTKYVSRISLIDANVIKRICVCVTTMLSNFTFTMACVNPLFTLEQHVPQ